MRNCRNPKSNPLHTHPPTLPARPLSDRHPNSSSRFWVEEERRRGRYTTATLSGSPYSPAPEEMQGDDGHRPLLSALEARRDAIDRVFGVRLRTATDNMLFGSSMASLAQSVSHGIVNVSQIVTIKFKAVEDYLTWRTQFEYVLVSQGPFGMVDGSIQSDQGNCGGRLLKRVYKGGGIQSEED
ncbi:unnamed protein product [Cuscuta europaea]|uniref:Uncharacterized protein n=1 Tax=Cuscuta europaea TaxID=41803 RepID=A0A9P0YUJ9_CUSEU|nr:unnamed protein product [Cuscuta europaea]